MTEDHDLISYDEDWQSVSEPAEAVTVTEAEPEEGVVAQKRRFRPKQPVLTVQLLCCLLLAAAAFVLKSVGGEWYDTAREWYFEQLNDTAVFDGSRDVDLQRLSGTATADEI